MRILIKNSMCHLGGVTPEQFKALRLLLSYKVSANEAYFSGRFRSNVRYLMNSRGDFPTGLLYLVYEYARNNNIPIALDDSREFPKISEITGSLFMSGKAPSPYPEQLEAAERARIDHRGIISAPTGSGKSLIIALICDKFKVPTLIVTPSLELKRQLTQSLKHWFGEHVAGPLVDDKPKYLITVENVDALDPCIPMVGIDLVIIDEFHHSAAKTYRVLNQKAWNNIYFRFGLTATPFRSNENERLLLESILSKVIHRTTYPQAVEKGYIVPVEPYFVEMPKIQVKGDRYSWPSMYKELVVENEYRNEAVNYLMRNLHDQGISTLCLVKEIAHGEKLSKMTGVAFANGQEEMTRQLILEFNLGERKQLIGTMGILGEGVGTKPAEYVILAGGGKAKTQFMQNIGRGVRRHGEKTSCKVILFKDISHKWLINHWNTQVKILKEEYGIKPVRLTI